MRTLSKFGLAGVRLGYMVGPAALIGEDRQGAPALQRQRAQRRGGAVSRSSMPTSTPPGRPAAPRERERLQKALRGDAGRQAFPSEGQHDPGARARMPRAFDGLKRGRAGQEHFAAASTAGNCLRLTVGPTERPDRPTTRLMNRGPESMPTGNPECADRIADVAATPTRRKIRVALNLDGSGEASSPPASASSTTCSTRSPATAIDRPRHRGRRATCTSTATTRWRTSASRWAGGGAGGRRQEGPDALRPRLRAAGRGAVARGGRLLRPPGPAHGRAVHRRHGRRLRHPAHHEFFQGFVNHALGDAAHRQPEGRQRPPPVPRRCSRPSAARCAWRWRSIRARPA